MILLVTTAAMLAPAARAQTPNPFYQVADPDAIRYLDRDELIVDGPLATFEIRLPSGELLTFDSVNV